MPLFIFKKSSAKSSAMDATRDWDVLGHQHTDAFAHPSPFAAADVLDPSLFPNQSQVQGDWHTDAFIRPSLPPQPFAAADVLDPSLFPNQSQVQGDWHTDAFIRPSLLSQSFVDHPSFQSSVNGG